MSYSLELTGEQIRAGRALARIKQAELAERSQVSLETIKRLESMQGVVEANSRTISAIAQAFEVMGIVFACEGGSVGVSRLADAGDRRGTATTAAGRGLAAPGRRNTAAEVLHRLVFYSTAKVEVTDRLKAILDSIVASSLRRNSELGVTGALLARNGRFLQVLEGVKEAVWQAYGAISSDPRHMDISVIDNRPIFGRQFCSWTLCCGQFDTDGDAFAYEPAIADGFRPERLSSASAMELLRLVRDLQALPPRLSRGEHGECPLAAKCLDRFCAISAGGTGLPSPTAASPA